MYTITRKSSSRRQSSNSIDSCDNVCSNLVKASAVTAGSHLKRSSYLALDDVRRSCKSAAMDLTCSPNRSTAVANWLKQSQDFLSSSPRPASPHRHLDGYGYLTPSPPASCHSPPSTCADEADFDRFSCCSAKETAADGFDVGYLTPPGDGKSCSSFSCCSSSISSSSSSLFSSSQADTPVVCSDEHQFSCLYLLASAAVSELERQRTSSLSPASSSFAHSHSQTVPFKKRNHLRPDESAATAAATAN